MPRFEKKVDGRNVTVETSNAREASELRAEGFRESKARTADTRAADGVSKSVEPVKADTTKSSK